MATILRESARLENDQLKHFPNPQKKYELPPGFRSTLLNGGRFSELGVLGGVIWRRLRARSRNMSTDNTHATVTIASPIYMTSLGVTMLSCHAVWTLAEATWYWCWTTSTK